jgi:uncharacterized protein involved in outer membrane biogenesis
MAHRSLKWLAALLLALPVLAILWVTIFGWNWARGPLQHITSEKTGRELVIGGDLKVSLGWPAPRVRAEAVTFANPPWAKEKQMVAVDDVEFTLDLFELLRKNLVFPEVRLTRPVVFLELAADGRKTWLLDLHQSDETARIPIGRLTLDHGRLGYDDAKQKTSIRSDISTQGVQAGGADAAGVVFSAKGLYKGLTLAAHGSGGSVLALHDESVPYPLKVNATVGHTGIEADGTVTSLLKFSAMDMHLELHGDSLELLFPLIGIAVPETHSYATTGRIVHSGQMWRYEKFSGHIGKSDIAGTVQVDTGNARPFMRGDLVSEQLDFDDLGTLIGAKAQQPAPAAQKVARAPEQAVGGTEKAAAPAPAAVAGPHRLPDIPFKTERWASVDADVTLHAKTILRAKELPLENLVTHLKMQDSLLTLDPLDFGFAGGHLKAVISLDGRQDPIQARARIGARKILLAKLFPTLKLAKTSVGQINGEFDLAGKGNSVGRMLATSDGRIGLIVANGEISKLLMEEIGLHLLEILRLKITGDKTIKLRCGVADFGVKSGVMKANALVLDTEVSTIVGSGSIDLGQEKLDLTLVPKTRYISPVALRSPIYVRGTFSNPEVDLDKGRIAARGAGALALGLINPLLALIPLVEMGPGIESECARLIHEAQAPLPNAPGASAPGSPK